MVELRLVELRGLVDDEGSGPEVPPLEIGREDTVPTPAVEIPAVLTGTNVGNNTSDDIVIDGTTKQIPSEVDKTYLRPISFVSLFFTCAC